MDTRAPLASTVTEAFRRTVETAGDRVAVRTLDDAVSLTWAELARRAGALAGGLARLGVKRGDTVAILLGNRPEFHVVDLAAMLLGATPFSIYQTLPPEQIAFVMTDAGARVAVVEAAFLPAMLRARERLSGLAHVIVVDGERSADTLALAEVEGSNPGFDVESTRRGVAPDDFVTLIYTSGTTGAPKGVQLTHRNVIAGARAMQALLPLPAGARVISWLPAAHIAERAAHHYLPVVFGWTITCCPNPRELISYLPQVRPEWFFAVPRIWEKLKAGLEVRLGGLEGAQRARIEAALAAGHEKVRLEQAGQPVPDALAARVAEADAALFAPLRAALGLDAAAAVNTGAAPTPPEVIEFFHAIGIPLGELWGMSETTGSGAVNPPGRIKIGTVGPPVPGAEIKLAPDGEVLIRGDMVMAGYRNQPEKTAEALDADGWLATGDIGAFDADGYLRIVDRKKELLITSAGKNLSPANIEAVLKTSSGLIGHACVIGDRRPYITALLVLDPDAAPAWAARHGLAGRSLEELAAEPALIAALQADVGRANERLARPEQIKRFFIVPGDWQPGGDELTPTLKLKRRPIAEKYTAAIEAMYAEGTSSD